MTTCSSILCSGCNQVKPKNAFYFIKSKNDDKLGKYRTFCRVCEYQKRKTRISDTPLSEDQIAKERQWSSDYEKKRRNSPNTRFKVLWADYRKSDNKKNRENDLSKEQVAFLISLPCSYCGSLEKISLDRIDNSIGHLLSNVTPSCLRCNLVRGDMPYEAWLCIAYAMKIAYEQELFGEWWPGHTR